MMPQSWCGFVVHSGRILHPPITDNDVPPFNPLDDEGLPKPGAIIGDFKITKPIGAGGCGAVFEAFHERMNRSVAIKVLLPSAAGNAAGLAPRFLREIDLIKRLEHPNIVRLFDFGESEEGLLWMAMELVRGQELAELLTNEIQLTSKLSRKFSVK